MALVRRSHRALPALALVAGAILAPSRAAAQGRAPDAFLVLSPVPVNAGDSTAAIQLGDAIRKKLDGKLRLKLRVITKENIAKALEGSGFPPTAILDENGATQLARFMNVDAYMTGRWDKAASSLQVRLVDNRRSGISGWFTVKGLADNNLVDAVADSVDLEVKAAEQARECLDRRDKGDYGSAKERAERAFKMYPNHPSTAMCVFAINETMKASPDTQIAILKRAIAGDSLLGRAWEALIRQYQAKKDTAGWAEASVNALALDPTDMRKRLAAAALLMSLKEYPQAATLVDEGLQRAPGDPQATALKLQICFEGQMWACAGQAMAARYQTDTALQKDSMYMKQLLAAAQAVNDPNTVKDWSKLTDEQKKLYQQKPDTAAVMKWTGIAVQKFPNSASFWKARAAALKDAGKTDEALAAYNRIAELDDKDVVSRIAAVQMLEERLKIDTLTPLDTATVSRIDQLLTQVAANATDDNLKMNVAVMYFTPATKMIGAKQGLDRALDMLEKARANDVKKQLTAQINFYEGLDYVFALNTKFDFTALSKSKDCKQLSALNDYMNKMNGLLDAGQTDQTRATVTQIKAQLGGLTKFIGQAKPAWQCKF